MDKWNETLGAEGEKRTVRYLVQRGFKILCRNYRCRFGEIDVIAYEPEKNIVCFIEVKTRSGLKKGLPCEAVTPAKLNRIKRTAWHYMQCSRPACSGIRIDTAEVLCLEGRFYIRYIENTAF